MTTTIDTLQTRASIRSAVLATLGLAFAAALGVVLYLTITDGPTATIGTTRAPAVEAPSGSADSIERRATVAAVETPSGSADSIERRATIAVVDAYLGDARRYGSPDAAERSGR